MTATRLGAQLTLRVGDFAHVPDGAQFQEASEVFVLTAAETIKRLAESASSPRRSAYC